MADNIVKNIIKILRKYRVSFTEFTIDRTILKKVAFNILFSSFEKLKLFHHENFKNQQAGYFV